MSCGGQLESDERPELAAKKQALAPVSVQELVTAGAFHSLYLQKNGDVWAWGQNNAGQVGTGNASTTPVNTPTKLTGVSRVKALAAGVAHSLALDVDGKVWAWGQNVSGQVGTGSAGGTVPNPSRVQGLPDIEAIAANGSFSLALDVQGQVWAWGQNSGGQVGKGATSASEPVPLRVSGLPTIRAIAAGLNHALALDAAGRVWGWGQNTAGQVGGATSTNVLVPRQVANLPVAKAIAAGLGHSLAIEAQSGKVYAWGQNNAGQVGTGTATTNPVLTPSFAVGVSGATAIAAGHNSSFALLGGGVVRSWGSNASGTLGNGSTTNSASPVEVTGLTDAKAIAAGAQHALAVRPGCPVWAWGNNGQAQLGTGSSTPASAATPVQSGVTNTYYFDSDLDGYGEEFLTEQACEPSFGYVEELDCNDYDATIYPGAPELCNGMDDNCDQAVDDGNPGSDEDCATGVPGVCATGKTACTNGTVTCVQTQTASDELCDGLDNDCDGDADEDNPEGVQDCSTGQLGRCDEGVTYCTGGVLHCAPKVPASSEVCDGLDNDCDGQADEELPILTWYPDADGDGYGGPGQTVQGCRQPAGYSANNTDCADTNPARHPGASEVCDGQDNNCNAQADEGLPTQTWVQDADGDGFGTSSVTLQSCRQPSGYILPTLNDCDDANANIKPGATEVCNGRDDNCSGAIDEGLLLTWYLDQDNDGYGLVSQTLQSCTQPGGYVANPNDCLDTNPSVRPGGTEVCNQLDDDCDQSTDEGVTTTYYRDADGDTYGNANVTTAACSAPGGYVSNTQDCNDGNASIKPGATETCNAVDDNCSGTVDEGNPGGDQQCNQGACGYWYTVCSDGQLECFREAVPVEICRNGEDDDCDGVVDDGCNTCFVAGTPISLADGTTKPIEELSIGDRVLAYDVDAQKVVPAPVIETFAHEASSGILLINGSLRATENHPFYANGRWVRADELQVGDELVLLDTSEGLSQASTRSIRVSSLSSQPQSEATYNIEVSIHHNYFAGGILVHNKELPVECGNGVCRFPEDWQNCPADCG